MPNKVKIKKIRLSDKKRILNYLLHFYQKDNNRAIRIKSNINTLFNIQWNKPFNHFGYFIDKNNDIKGMIGCIYSYRKNNNYKICNLTSWVVDSEYRSFSVDLIFQVLNENNDIITALTPNKVAYRIYKEFKFKPFGMNIINLIPVFNFKKTSIETNKFVRSFKSIVSDHMDYGYLNIIYRDLLIIYKKIKYKKLPFARILYISDELKFKNYLSEINLFKLFFKKNILGFILNTNDEDYYKFANVIKINRRKYPFMYISNTSDIKPDLLYSEISLFYW